MSLLPTCREMARLMSDARDAGRPLGWHARIHLGICEACRRVLKQFALLGALAKTADAGPGLSAEARERLKKTLR